MKNPFKRKAKSSDKTPATPQRKAMLAKAGKLLKAFGADTPHEAAQGFYSFNIRDRWHGKRPGALDGWYSDGAWSIRIQGGLPTTAIRADYHEQPAGKINKI